MSVVLAVQALTKVGWLSRSAGDGGVVGFLGGLAKKGRGEGSDVDVGDKTMLVMKVTAVFADG